jgi:hypothetical protein
MTFVASMRGGSSWRSRRAVAVNRVVYPSVGFTSAWPPRSLECGANLVLAVCSSGRPANVSALRGRTWNVQLWRNSEARLVNNVEPQKTGNGACSRGVSCCDDPVNKCLKDSLFQPVA